MREYLYDKNFLKQLDYNRTKETHARLIVLNQDGAPVEEITGKVTGGSINIDGTSIIRRSCSISLIAFEQDNIITDTYWGFNHNFKLEIGITNNINNKYPDIIWFNMGIYIITAFTKSEQNNRLNITISGKDKMCRLNGDVGGIIMMPTDFGTEEVEEKVEEINSSSGQITVTTRSLINKLPIKKIIQNAVKDYGLERPENIIINDLDQPGYELWEYRGEDPMYFFIDADTKTVVNISFDGNIYIDELKSSIKDFETKNLPLQYYSMNTLDKDYNNNATKFTFGNITNCCVAKISCGETAGYHQTPLVYNADLILSAQDTVVGLLDKLKNMLGDFEYFYDLEGRFVFQKKNTYIQELFSPIDGGIPTPTLFSSFYSYKFEDKQLFTNFSSNSNLNNVKNDFSVWGTRQSVSGDGLPIHARCAIDIKPTSYNSPWTRYENLCYLNVSVFKKEELPAFEDEQNKFLQEHNIYIQTPITTETKFSYIYERITKKNKNEVSGSGWYELTEFPTFNNLPIIKEDKNEDSKNDEIEEDVAVDKTQYQILYIRGNNEYRPLFCLFDEPQNKELFNDDGNFQFEAIENTSSEYLLKDQNGKVYTNSKTLYENIPVNYTSEQYDWREIIYQMALDFYQKNGDSDYYTIIQNNNSNFKNGKTGYEQYYTDLQGFWRQLYNPSPTTLDIVQYGEFYDDNGSDGKGADKYWNKKIHQDPNLLNFWFEFLDTAGELRNFSVKNIGVRNKAINDNNVHSIYYKETPEALFIVSPKETFDPTDDDNMALIPIQIQESMELMFYRSGQSVSAIEKINELIYQHTAITEPLQITSIPIYYLQPNTRIYIEGHGDYTLDSIQYNLAYNGTMQLTGNKILKQFY